MIKKILSFTLVVLAAIFCTTCEKPTDEIPDLSGVEILTRHVAGNVYMLEATGDVAGNVAVSAGPEGFLLVDTQFAPLSSKILGALQEIGQGEVKYIINSHFHADHVHGNAALGQNATVVAHSNTRKRLSEELAARLPDVIFTEQMSLKFNDEDIKLIHFAHGHSDSDIVIHFTESNVWHLGDLWNSGSASFPLVDLIAGGSLYGMLENVRALTEIIPEDAKIIPGHYALSDLEGLKATLEMLIETIGLVSRKKAAGITLGQIKQEGLPLKYAAWGKAYTGADAWIENIYLGLEARDVGFPEILKQAQFVAKKFYLNEQGYWEAVLADNHVLVYIPAGEFTMGSDEGLPNEQPVHKVFLDGYWLAKHPVTVGQFRQFIAKTDYVTDAEKGQGSWQYWEGRWIVRLDGNWKNTYFEQGEDHPVVSVSWNDAMAYCDWLSQELELDFLLPTAAQWEKGARGTDQRPYPWGPEIPDGTRANYADINFWKKYDNSRPADQSIDDGYVETSPVGSYPAGASPYGLLDMAGNVWEWCYDVYADDTYATSPDRNPLGPPATDRSDQDRVDRGGGSWTDRSGHITPEGGHNLRSAARTGDEQNSSDDHLGFRLAIWGRTTKSPAKSK